MKSGRQKRENFGAVNISKSVSDSINMDSPLINSFIGFRADLDAHQDKHERLVKTSRDITIISKRIIFNLHRCVGKLLSIYIFSYFVKNVTNGRSRLGTRDIKGAQIGTNVTILRQK